jgi:hypothetical protein
MIIEIDVTAIVPLKKGPHRPSATLFRRDLAARMAARAPTSSAVDGIDIRLRRTAIGTRPRRLQPFVTPR